MAQNRISLVHIVHQPTVPSVSKPPLLILLHGVGSNENDLIGLAPHLDGRFLTISLRAPLSLGSGGYGWYEIQWTSGGITHDEQSAVAGQHSAELAIDEIVSAYGADPQRVYLIGFSQGAIMSLAIALTNPEKIAGAVIMSGRLLPHVASNPASTDRLKDLPILVVHGTQDTVLGIVNGREINRFLEDTSVDLIYHEYNMAHSVSQESLSDISKWLSDQLDRPK